MRGSARWTFLFALVFLLGASPPPRAHEAEKARAREAAESWLSLTDAGNAETSWETAAELFRKAVSKEKWAEALQAARGPLGKLKSREFKSAEYATGLPGAPDGAYVVLQYESSFETKRSAIETITPMREKDGSWKVSGYYIR